MKGKHTFFSKIMSRVVLLSLLLLGTLLFASCNMQSRPETYRVGVLSGLDFVAGITDGFKAQMTELGYVEGENIEYDVQMTNFDIPAYQRILNQFVEDKVDLILVFPTEASIEAKNIAEGSGIPVVFSFALIEGMGLVNNVREPGGNITGVRYPGPEVALRRFEILRQIAPDKTHFILPYQRGYPIVAPQLEILYPAAEAAGVTLTEVPADNAEEMASVLQALSESGDMENSAILMLVEPLLVTADAYALASAFAAEFQMPMGGVMLPGEGYGSLFLVSVDAVKMGELAALQADKIFQGAAAGTISVISADMTLVINNRQAEDLGLEVPEELLTVADEIIR